MRGQVSDARNAPYCNGDHGAKLAFGVHHEGAMLRDRLVDGGARQQQKDTVFGGRNRDTALSRGQQNGLRPRKCLAVQLQGIPQQNKRCIVILRKRQRQRAVLG